MILHRSAGLLQVTEAIAGSNAINTRYRVGYILNPDEEDPELLGAFELTTSHSQP